MLPASSLSAAAYSIRQLFLLRISDLKELNQIRIGHPADNIKDLEETEENCLNLFFYDVNYDGYPADGSSDNPFYVRLHCLITAVGAKSEDPALPGGGGIRDVSKGENELRLIGEVMRILHEQPLLAVGDTTGNEIAVLQIIPYPMNLDNLNHIWSTQTDISYRLSVAYEMALAPVPHVTPAEVSPLVGDPRMVVWGAMSREAGREQDGVISLQPQVEYLELDTDVDNWVPHICCVETLADDARQLHYVFRVTGDPDASLDILIAGRAGAEVTLFWNVWCKKTDNSVVAWKENIADLHAPIQKVIATPTDPADTFAPETIDPDDINSRSIFQASLPDDVKAADIRSWQAVLHAVHEWTHTDPVDAGETITTALESNTILFYGGGA